MSPTIFPDWNTRAATELCLVATAFGSLALIGVLRFLRRVREPHHGYWGICLALLALAVPGNVESLTAAILAPIACVLVWEDAIQHYAQTTWWVPTMRPLTGADDHGPIHRFTYWLGATVARAWRRLVASLRR